MTIVQSLVNNMGDICKINSCNGLIFQLILLTLLEGRILHGAGLVVDTVTNMTMMVVSGGLGASDQFNLNSTEILVNGKWEQGM